MIGLDNVRSFSLASLTGPAPAGSEGTPSASGGVEGVLTPQDLWGVYDDPVNPANPTSPLHTNVDFGQGQTMGIFGEGETSA